MNEKITMQAEKTERELRLQKLRESDRDNRDRINDRRGGYRKKGESALGEIERENKYAEKNRLVVDGKVTVHRCL